MLSNHLILLSPSHPVLNLSHHQGLFKWVSSPHQVAKVLEFQLQHQSFQWTPRTGPFWMDWLDLLAAQGTLKSLFQHHSSKASVLLCSAFFIVQLSHRYMTTGKTIALTRWTFVDKVISLLFNMLSRLIDDAVKVLHSICQQIWKTQQWSQDWKRSVFIPISKKGNTKECSNYCTVALISHASKVML